MEQELGSSRGGEASPVDLARVDDGLDRAAHVGALHLLCRGEDGPAWSRRVAQRAGGSSRQTMAGDGCVCGRRHSHSAEPTPRPPRPTCKALQLVGGGGARVQHIHVDQHNAVGLAAVRLLRQVEPLPVLLGPLLEQGAPAARQRGPGQAVRRKPVVAAARGGARKQVVGSAG